MVAGGRLGKKELRMGRDGKKRVVEVGEELSVEGRMYGG